MDTLEYAPGRAVDVHPGGTRGHVLVWHGRGPNQRPALVTLGALVAEHGLTVVVPDWSSEERDGGRSELLASLRFTRDLMERDGADPDALTLVGWSLGGAAAVGVTFATDRLGVGVAHVVGLGNGGYRGDEPISGGPIPAEVPRDVDRPPFTLLHGVADDIAPVAGARAFAQQLEQQDWPVELVELPTDHWGIVGTTYDAATDVCSPADDDATRRVVQDVADRIAAAALSRASR
ncbi:alpha/beta hydrolase family protein [Aeromicrobium terrae]|uniref:Esterase n=1 Tax=Aeromicrobium terrae TaxID=2498846 RepID=A0A5C8NE40_9ACTN|nr:esterase [Aeromicrobium terrae]TXL56565.1 esterase [Aeromicrobium terrae]